MEPSSEQKKDTRSLGNFTVEGNTSTLELTVTLPPDFPPVHSCRNCETLILDPNAGQRTEYKGEGLWASFDPILTVGALKKYQEGGCLLAQSAVERIDLDLPRVDSNREVLYSLSQVYSSVILSVPLCEDEFEEYFSTSELEEISNELKPNDIVIVRWWDCTLMSIPGWASSQIIRVRPVNVDPGSCEAFKIARQSLQICRTTHGKCRNVGSTSTPESLRLISISCEQGDFRVRLTETHGGYYEYCALSYCWGDCENTKTTLKNIDQFKSALPFTTLPATVRDAIRTTYELGLCYLFVDALCIIQDDADDMQAQISEMPHIYGQATVTILASRARSAQEGFLQKRSSPIPPSKGCSGEDCIIARTLIRCPGDVIGFVLWFPETSLFWMEKEVIDDRAWVLQERLLARRTLDYRSLQTIWSCLSADEVTDGWSMDCGRAEHNPRWIPEIIRHESHQRTTDNSGDLKIHESHLWQWRVLVMDYTRRKLTDPRDKLLAIAALADRVNLVLQDDYLAGIWRSSFPEYLLWKVLGTRRPRPATYRAPSWSWASVEGEIDPILYAAAYGPCRLEVLDWHTDLTYQEAKYGAVKGGCLYVRGRIRHVVLMDSVRNAEGDNVCYEFMDCDRPHMEGRVPVSFDAHEREFEEATDQAMEIAMLEVLCPEDGRCTGLVLRSVGHQIFSRLGVFGIVHWSYGFDDLDDDEERREWYQSYSDWGFGFDECDDTIVTIV